MFKKKKKKRKKIKAPLKLRRFLFNCIRKRKRFRFVFVLSYLKILAVFFMIFGGVFMILHHPITSGKLEITTAIIKWCNYLLLFLMAFLSTCERVVDSKNMYERMLEKNLGSTD